MSTLTLFLLVIPLLILVLLALNLLFAIHKPDSEKVTPYECGFSPIGDSRSKFSVHFYLVGILFLIFDLEILFIYPLAVTLYHINIYGFWIAILFLVILTIGFVYEYSKGALKFTNKSHHE